jgi:hypothetical protein
MKQLIVVGRDGLIRRRIWVKRGLMNGSHGLFEQSHRWSAFVEALVWRRKKEEEACRDDGTDRG